MRKMLVKFNDSCPICGGGNVEWSSETYERDEFVDEFTCMGCGARWYNRYAFVRCEAYAADELEG